MPDPFTEPHVWFHEMIDNPTRMLSSFAKICDQPGKLHRQPDASAVALPLNRFVCTECNQVFPSRQQLLSHSFSKHGYRNPLRSRIITHNCLACNLLLHSRQRVLRHLRRKDCVNPCAFYYMENVEPFEQESVLGNFGEKVNTKELLKPAVQL